MSAPHDRPDVAEILEAVREWLTADVMTTGDPRLRFHARVAVNMLAIAERQLELGEAQGAAHSARLARLGVADDAELAARLRDGSLDDRFAEVYEVLVETVADKLAVANPTYR